MKILKDKVYDKDDPLTIERIHDKLSLKFEQINKELQTRTSRED